MGDVSLSFVLVTAGLKDPILQGAEPTRAMQCSVNGFVHVLKVKHFVKCFCLIRPDRAVPCGIECKVRHTGLEPIFSSVKLKMKRLAPSSANN